jgi:curved DNA-binding protein CbpA
MQRLKDLKKLGLSASDDDRNQIRKAFYKLALTRHPDKGGTKEAFQTINDA